MRSWLKSTTDIWVVDWCVCVCVLKDFPTVTSEQQWSDSGRGLRVDRRLGFVINLMGFNHPQHDPGSIEAEGNMLEKDVRKRRTTCHLCDTPRATCTVFYKPRFYNRIKIVENKLN